VTARFLSNVNEQTEVHCCRQNLFCVVNIQYLYIDQFQGLFFFCHSFFCLWSDLDF